MKSTFNSFVLIGIVSLIAGCDQLAEKTGQLFNRDADATLILQNASVIDIRSGAVLEDRSVVIVDGVIDQVIPDAEASGMSSAETLDISGKFVIPGLWDMHVHLGIWEWQVAFPMLLQNGVLGVREMGWALNEPSALRDRIDSGELLGPRMFVAGATLDGPTDNWPFRITVADVGEVEGVISSLQEANVDFVKVHQQLARDVYFEIASKATEAGFAFSGHVPSTVTATEAANAGQASVEHMIMPWCDFESDAAAADENGCGNPDAMEAIHAFRENGTWMTPTATVYGASYIMWADETALEARLPLASRGALESWAYQREVNEQFMPPLAERAPLFLSNLEAVKKMIRFLDVNDIPMMTGTDSGYLYVYPGLSLWDELEIWIDAGVAPLKALQSATIKPARFLGMDDVYGAVEPGYAANLAILDANPLTDLAKARNVSSIVLNGHHMTHAEITSYYMSQADN